MPFYSDASKLQAGSIIRIEHPTNSRGNPTYQHDFVVLTIPAALKVGDKLRLVGISSRVSATHPSLHVTMTWLNRKGGDPDTGFSKICHACIDFPQLLNVTAGPHFEFEVAAEHNFKFIRTEKLQTLVALANAWARRPGK